MDKEDVALSTISKTTNILTAIGMDPIVIQLFIFFVAVIAVFGFIIVPLLKSLHSFMSDKNSSIVKAETDKALWTSVKETIAFQNHEIDSTREDNKGLTQTIKDMEKRIKKLEGVENNFNNLKLKLDEKDKLIAKQYEEILKRDDIIKELSDRVKILEEMLATRNTT